MQRQAGVPIQLERIETKEDVIKLANEGCIKLFHVDLAALKAALDAKGMPFTKEGLMLLAVMAKMPDPDEGKE